MKELCRSPKLTLPCNNKLILRLYVFHSSLVSLGVMSTFKRSKREPESAQSQEGSAGRDSMGRRVWDKEYFAQKYEASSSLAEPPKKVIKGPTESLKERESAISVDNIVNKRQLVTNASSKTQQGGFYCQVCDCLLRDSRAYYDHINGRNHNRMLGMTMNVEKVTVERVIAKMERIKAGLE